MKEWNILDYGSADRAGLAVKKVLAEIKSSAEPARLIFPKGIYRFHKEDCFVTVFHTSNTDSQKFPEKHVAILLEDIHDLEIDGGGSLFLFHGDVCAVTAIHCSNITLRNITWDYPCPTTVEMRCIKAERNSAVFSLPENQQWSISGRNIDWFEKSPLTGKIYWKRRNMDNSWCVNLLDTNKKTLVRGSRKTTPLSNNRISIKKIDNKTLEIRYLGKPDASVKEGMIFVLCPNCVRPTSGVFFSECQDMTAENIQPLYLHGFSWLVQMCKNITMKGCKFTPKENAERFITSYGDSLHIAGAGGFVHIEDCDFSHDLDDPINIHGSFMRVEKMLDSRTLKLIYCHDQQGGFAQFHEGDKVEFYSRETLKGVENEKLYTVKNATHPLENGNDFKTSIVEFNEELPAYLNEKTGNEGKYVAENVTYTPDVIIRNCRFSYVPTRGILCTTRGKVLIENNFFDSMTMASVYISNDSNDWYESGPVRDVTIRNNIFYIRKSPQNEHFCKGGIFVDPITKGGKLPHWSEPIHKNITVEGNTFRMEHDNVVRAKSVENMTVKNNTIELLQSPDSDKTIKAFSFTACKNIVISGNICDENIDITAEYSDMPESEIIYG